MPCGSRAFRLRWRVAAVVGDEAVRAEAAVGSIRNGRKMGAAFITCRAVGFIRLRLRLLRRETQLRRLTGVVGEDGVRLRLRRRVLQILHREESRLRFDWRSIT